MKCIITQSIIFVKSEREVSQNVLHFSGCMCVCVCVCVCVLHFTPTVTPAHICGKLLLSLSLISSFNKRPDLISSFLLSTDKKPMVYSSGYVILREK